MKQLVLFGDEHTLSVWLRACTYMGPGWEYKAGERTFIHVSGASVFCYVMRDIHDQAKLRASSRRFDFIVEHASFGMSGSEWDAYVRAYLLTRP